MITFIFNAYATFLMGILVITSIYERSNMMSNITVYNVIELGVNNLLSDYDNWNVEEVLDKETQHFPNTFTLAIWSCINNL